jgi:hypothetical protein
MMAVTYVRAFVGVRPSSTPPRDPRALGVVEAEHRRWRPPVGGFDDAD